MAHETAEVLDLGPDFNARAEESGVRFEYRTEKIGKALRSTIYEWNRDTAGFWGWNIFLGWRVTLANSSGPATLRKVEGQHAAYRVAALDAARLRVAALAAAVS